MSFSFKNFKHITKYKMSIDALTNSQCSNIQSALRVQPTDIIAPIGKTKIGENLHWNQYKI